VTTDTTTGTSPRIIERQMPLTVISAQSAREKSIRHGHLSTLHIWWARRPLAACRAAIFAALVPQPDDPKEAAKMQTFIGELSNWDNAIDSDSASGRTGVHHYIRDARDQIRRAFPDRPPRVLDPFAGGGAIPLEALRLGCETHALDLNPVAHIIQLATLVYPQKYANRPGPYGDKPGATLAGDVRKWGLWVLDRAREEIGDLYPKDSDGSTVVAYLWARTIPCPNPACGVPVPLIRQTWLARKPSKHVAYKVESAGPGTIPRFTIHKATSAKELGFDPTVATARGGSATCPSCGTPLSDPYIKSEAVAGRLGELPVAVVTDTPAGPGKRYREVTAEDVAVFDEARRRLHEVQESFDPFAGELSPVPDEPVPTNDVFNVRLPIYGLMTWGSIYNDRQALAMQAFARNTRKAHSVISETTGDADYARAVSTYLGIAVDRLVDRCTVLCLWHNGRETLEHVFARQAVPMVMDYAEVNPFSGSTGDWAGALEWIWRYIAHGAATSDKPATVRRGTAASLPYPDGYFDAIVTDPPYYNNVGYSSLADFFYVWLKRTIGDLHPSALGTPTVPKEQEIVEGGQMQRSKAWFEVELGRAFAESARVLRDDGICTVVYAHKAITAWESLVAALLTAGLTVEASWPLTTEMATRQMASNKAALASSIFLVCRKRKTDAGVGIAGDVRRDIEENVRERLDEFWAAGLRGADFFISAIGPATAAFSRYDRVMTMGGEDVTVSSLLEWVQETVADYALRRVLTTAAQEQHIDTPDGGLGHVDDPTRFYVLWRWTYDGQASIVGTPATNDRGAEAPTTPAEDVLAAEGATAPAGKTDAKKIPFGDAHLMATALGADINALINRHHLLEGSSTVRLLSATEREIMDRDLGDFRADGSRPLLIDVLHHAELLWATGQQDALEEYISQLISPDREALRRVAQALVDLLPRGDAEKQRLEGFLYSGAASDTGTPGVVRPEPVRQAGLGEEFGQSDLVVHPRRK